MNPTQFNELSEEEQDWLDAYLDGTIEPGEFSALQDRMIESPALRAIMRRYLALDNSLQNESGDVEIGSDKATDPWLKLTDSMPDFEPRTGEKIINFPSFAPIAAAAAVAFLLGLAFMNWISQTNAGGDANLVRSETGEPSAQGFAVIGRLFDAAWPERETVHREGDTLGAEVFRLASGTAEIQFFSGATMTVEGPAEISLKSAWEASCLEGAVRMRVPPAARGFKLQAPSTEIIDLGTEFGLVVRDGKGHVEVFDGEIAVRHQGEKERLMKKGGALGLTSEGPATPEESGRLSFPDVKRFGSRAADEQLEDFRRWQAHRDSLATDERLLAYYSFDREPAQALIPNLTVPRNPKFDGAVNWPSRSMDAGRT